MTALEFTKSRFPGEAGIRAAMADPAVELLVEAEGGVSEKVVAGGFGADVATHQQIGKSGGLKVTIPDSTRQVLAEHQEELRLVLVAHSVGAALSRVLVNMPIAKAAELVSQGTESFPFRPAAAAALDPLRASVTLYELHVCGPDDLPVWRRSWRVKVQENKGSWLMYPLDENKAKLFAVPTETYLYSDLESLEDDDMDLNNAKFYVNAAIYDRLHEMPRADQCLLVRTCLGDIVDHLSRQPAPEDGGHSLLESIWGAFTDQVQMDTYSNGEERLSSTGRRVLLGNVDRQIGIAKHAVEKLSSTQEEYDDQ